MESKSATEISNEFNPIENIKLYLSKKSCPLFKTLSNNHLTAIFDDKGFVLSNDAQAQYDTIKHEPHLYIAFIHDTFGTTYIGKSNQKGGRWKRSHAYHLGTLAHHLNNSIRYDDQNHSHWIDAWMDITEITRNSIFNSIALKSEVMVVFIPFEIYSGIESSFLTKEEIKSMNHRVEAQLIRDYSIRNVGLLNRQGR